MSAVSLQRHRAHDLAVQRVLADARADAQLKLLAVLLRREADLGEKRTTRQMMDVVFPRRDLRDSAHAQSAAWRRMLVEDIRRYEPQLAVPPNPTCPAMMPRAKRLCGRYPARSALMTNPLTGERVWIGYCRRHLEAFEEIWELNHHAVMKAREQGGIPRPYAIAGGVVAAHVPEVDWPALWKKLKPEWEPYPERSQGPAPVKPTLRLILGEG